MILLCRPKDKLKLFQESDFIVCALPGTAQTENFCGAAEFAAMKTTGIFISVGRGLAVDEVRMREMYDAYPSL